MLSLRYISEVEKKKLYSKKQKGEGSAKKFPEKEVKVLRVRERDCLQVTEV